MKILFVAPVDGNGGIQSWTRNFIATFPDEGHQIVHVRMQSRRATAKKSDTFHRAWDGILDLLEARTNVLKALKQNPEISIAHITTSGSFGTLRDYLLGRVCQKHNAKIILHCHYGCIPENYAAKGFWGWLLRVTMRRYDNIWVLNSKSEEALKEDRKLRGKVFLTPNSISVEEDVDLRPKNYTRIAFVGNLVPEKGLSELIEATKKLDNVRLDIVGPGTPGLIGRVEESAGDLLDKRIFFQGFLPYDEAVKFMRTVDFVALPTYYPLEAFPISILEAMSLTKMVISSNRAAIPVMLTAVDGSKCGMLVRERSVEDIIDAVKWCQEHKTEADVMCRKAYEKVKTCYDTSVIYDLYRSLYDSLACCGPTV